MSVSGLRHVEPLESRACISCGKPFQTSREDPFDTCSPECSAKEYGEVDLDLVDDDDDELEDLGDEEEE